MTTQYNARVLSAPTIESITDAALKFLLGNRVLSAPVVAIGTTATNVRTDEFTFMIDGVVYTKAAVAAGSVFTDVAPQAANSTALYLVTVDVAGAILVINGESTPITGQPDDLRVPACPLNLCPVGVVKVACTTAFVPGTTALSAGTVTDTYYDLGCAVRSVP